MCPPTMNNILSKIDSFLSVMIHISLQRRILIPGTHFLYDIVIKNKVVLHLATVSASIRSLLEM
jgi:hypothetical protein